MSTYKFVTGVSLVALAGCASYPTPTAHLAQSMASVSVAQEAGAQANPQANDYLTRANEELANAKKLTDGGNKERADFMLLRADADAKLATELAKAERTEDGAKSAEGQAKAAAAAAQREP